MISGILRLKRFNSVASKSQHVYITQCSFLIQHSLEIDTTSRSEELCLKITLMVKVFHTSIFAFFQKEKDTKFKFARTRIWMYYISKVSPLPPPFNLIPVEKIASAVRWLARRYNWVKKVSK